MTEVYIVCTVLGLLIPFLSIVCNLFDGFIDFSFDIFNLDFGDITIDFLPISINSLCMASLLFGGVGLTITLNGGSTLVANIVGGVLGYLGAVSIQNLIKILRRNQSLADTEGMMLARSGQVITSIEPNKFGSVILSIDGSSDIQYTAENIGDDTITIKDDIDLISIDNGIAKIRKKVELIDKYKKEV